MKPHSRQKIMSRIAALLFTGVVCLSIAMMVLGMPRSANPAPVSETHDFLSQVAPSPVAPSPVAQLDSDSPAGGDGDAGAAGKTYPVSIRRPAGPPRIELDGADPQGRVGSVACSTCHAIRKPDRTNVSAETLDEFHQKMTFDHGKIACYACHNPDNADELRLADGTSVAYTDVMTLCSQCHGPQATAFAHGAHGGMNGHWDLTRGPQTKNNCVDCHDPHWPEYPKMIVGFKPKDRFNEPLQGDHQQGDPQQGDPQQPGADTHDHH